MITSESLLLNGQPHPIPTYLPLSGEAVIGPRLQAGRSAVEIVWQVLVEDLLGSPTTASLAFGIQQGFRTTRGYQPPPSGIGGGVGGSSWNMTDVAQQWYTIDGAADAALLPDGDFPIQIADQTISNGTLAAAVAVGDTTITSATQYTPGDTLLIDYEAFSVVGPPTISGANWVHPVMSHGSPTANPNNGKAAAVHSSGTGIRRPKAYRKRVLGGFDQRFFMIPTYTGGTQPSGYTGGNAGFMVTVNAWARY